MCITDCHDMTLAVKVALNRNVCSLFIEQSILSMETIQNAFLAHLSTTCSRGAYRVVMCPSCVVNNFFTHLLLPNRWANLDQTW